MGRSDALWNYNANLGGEDWWLVSEGAEDASGVDIGFDLDIKKQLTLRKDALRFGVYIQTSNTLCDTTKRYYPIGLTPLKKIK